jgi:hypothetical protein
MMLRYAELTHSSDQVRELMGLTLEEFTTIIPPLDAAFQAHTQE